MPVDINGFLARMGMKGVELQKRLGVSSGNLSQYKSNRSNPSYTMVCKLIEEGMTADELFGPELAKKLLENGAKGGPDTDVLFDSEKFKKGVIDLIMSDDTLRRIMERRVFGLVEQLNK